MKLLNRIAYLFQWIFYYFSLTPRKHYEVVYKLECLLCHATGGRFSKAGYSLENMEKMVTEYINECCDEAVEDALAELSELKERE